MKYFIDSSFIVALFKETDSNYRIAKNHIDIIDSNDCYITNGVLLEVITILMKRTKDNNVVKMAYRYLHDNFRLINEYDIKHYNDLVFSLFMKYNNDNFKVSFVDCSCIVISDYYNIDCVVTFDKCFKLFDEINLFDF